MSSSSRKDSDAPQPRDRGKAPARKPGKSEGGAKATVEDFGREGMGVAAKE